MARSANLVIPGGFSPLNARESDLVAIEVASAYGTDIYPGDPVVAVTAGGVQRTPAGSAAGAATDGITGVCMEILQYKDPSGYVRKNARYLPASTSWTNHGERSLLLVCLATEDITFRVKANAANASLTVARATRFANADHAYSGADTGLGISGAQLNLSTVNTTNTLQWRIVGFTDLAMSDPTLTSYQVEVIPNLPYALPIVGHLATGI